MLSSQKELVDNVEIKEPLGSSDHNQMYFNINVKSDKTKVKQCRRDFRKGNYREIRKNLAHIDWDEKMKNKTATECWDILRGELDTAIDSYVPMKKQGKRSKKKHLSKEAFRKMRYKQNMWRVYKHTGKDEDYEVYKEALNAATNEVRKAKRNFEHKLAQNIKSDSKSFYAYVRSKHNDRDKVGPPEDNAGHIITYITSTIQSGLLINDTSDHLPIFQMTDIGINGNKNNVVYSKKRIVTDRNICEIISELEKTEWDEILNSDDVNFSYETFVNKLTDIYRKKCPIVTSKVTNKRHYKPWMTSGLKNACKKKNLLYKYFLKSRSKQSEDKYKTYKNKLTTILRKCEKNYNTKLLELNKGNLKETWKLLNSIINTKKKTMQVGNEFENKGESITGDENIANGFNNYFVNVGPSLADNIPDTDTQFSQYLSASTNVKNSLFLNPVTDVEILQLVAKVKPKKSKGHDELDMCLIKKLIPYIVVPLKHIFNLSLLNGVFPDSMKIARVIPLFKSGNTKEFSNYRPISLLPQFSKILEKMYHSRLMAFIDSNQILYKSQYGFRKQMSTSLAIIELVEEITNSLDNHEATVGVFIDLKKAFDTVDHSILIEKLYHYGIRGTANKWICSYLMNRYQYVTINGTDSDYMNVLCGVPQGSILGPILFILYINDMCNVSTLLKPILFADDTNLFYSGKDIDELCSVVSMELDKLCIWSQVNKLSLNTSKTNFMVFTNRSCDDTYTVCMNGLNLSRVFVTQFLGVHMDSKLDWNYHY